MLTRVCKLDLKLIFFNCLIVPIRPLLDCNPYAKLVPLILDTVGLILLSNFPSHTICGAISI